MIKTKADWKNGEDDKSYGFAIWPIVDYVGVYGLEHPEKSLEVLKTLTPLFSAEFAIRPFLQQHFKITYNTMLEWSKDKDEHVRRLSSEGIRPRLPWGERLNQFIDDPKPILKILENLKDDENEFVRRSVANNLNDISKDHPELVTEVCKKWLAKPNKEREWIAKHATRGLVKKGYSNALELLGFAKDPKIEVADFLIASDKLDLGEELIFSFEVVSKAKIKQKLVVDYIIHFMKQNGRMSGKVFKLKNFDLNAETNKILLKKHRIKNISTRKYYSGKHKLDLMINGKVYKEIEFELNV
ncbi:MAG: DNA alkylation repair protein [Melioribacteraceae bacterium]|nr:DNA alkylation repair protein [Melioribacteraceae bacterium]